MGLHESPAADTNTLGELESGAPTAAPSLDSSESANLNDDHKSIDDPSLIPPDGGIRAWMTVFGCFLLSFTSYGQVNAFGVFQTYYAENQLQGRSASDISWIGSLQIGLIYVSGLVLGRFFDLHGSRVLFVSGWLLSAFSLMMLSISRLYYQIILSHGIGFGLGMALQFYPLLAIPSHWFLKRRAYVLGIVVAGSSLSGVLFPIMLSRLFPSIGFAWTVRTLAFLCFALQGVSIFLVKERLPHRKHAPRLDMSLRGDIPFILHLISGFFIAFGLYTPTWYISLYALKEGVSSNLSFYLISIANAAGMFGRIILGHVADKTGRFNTMIATLLIGVISVLAIWTTAHTAVALVWFAILSGLAVAAYTSIASSCTAQLTPDPSRIGARVGLFMTVMAPGITTGPSIAGAIMSDTNGSYLGLQLFVGSTLVVGTVFAIAARVAGSPHWRSKF